MAPGGVRSVSSGRCGCTIPEPLQWSTAWRRRCHASSAIACSLQTGFPMSDKTPRSQSTDTPELERMEDEGAPSSVDPTPGLADEIVELRKERDGLHDRLLRQAAEFDNYRKRIDRERRDTSEYAAAEVIQDLLPLI